LLSATAFSAKSAATFTAALGWSVRSVLTGDRCDHEDRRHGRSRNERHC
jgi:hypothetical protein